MSLEILWVYSAMWKVIIKLIYNRLAAGCKGDIKMMYFSISEAYAAPKLFKAVVIQNLLYSLQIQDSSCVFV